MSPPAFYTNITDGMSHSDRRGPQCGRGQGSQGPSEKLIEKRDEFTEQLSRLLGLPRTMKIGNPPSPPFSKGGAGGFETYF